jgi:hypothetical protein
MTAIVTTKFRVTNAENFKEDLSQSSVYIGIAKGDAWSEQFTDLTDAIDGEPGYPPLPKDYQTDTIEFHNNLIALKLLNPSDVTHTVPRYNWNAGEAYYAWDDRDEDIFAKPFFVMTSQYKIYKCLHAGPAASTVEPTTNSSEVPETCIDGYVWKFMCFIQAEATDRFLTKNFMPIRTAVAADEAVGGVNWEHYGWQREAIATDGAIYDIVMSVENGGGAGYTTPTVTIVGDALANGGVEATASAVVVDGVITKINVDNPGSKYKNAKVVITNPVGVATDATYRAVLPPVNGHGADPVRELGAFYVIVNAKLDGDEGEGDFIINNSFRQIAIVKAPFNAGTEVVATDVTLSGLKQMTLGTVTNETQFLPGDTFIGTTSGAQAYVDSYDKVTGVLKYHQNSKSGFIAFVDNDPVVANAGGLGTVSAGTQLPAEYERYSGEVIFLEDRGPVNRYAAQIEDVKIVIEF